MSSRSLAAARARRAGENAPPVSGNRPGTSIGSSAAFSQQMPPPPNVRLARAPQQAYPQSQQAYQPSQAYQQVQQSQQQSQNGLPFTKLSISDAIGLITMRLGRCEQWIIETEHENEENGGSTSLTGLPENSRIIDNSILTNFVSRLDSLEKREPGSNNSNIDTNVVSKLSEEVASLNEQLARIVEEASKHSLVTAKHTEQLFKFERELVETKDILKTFMLKYDTFTSETTEKLGDFEFAISEIEKNLPVIQENVVEENILEENANEETATADLKSLVQQELADVNM